MYVLAQGSIAGSIRAHRDVQVVSTAEGGRSVDVTITSAEGGIIIDAVGDVTAPTAASGPSAPTYAAKADVSVRARRIVNPVIHSSDGAVDLLATQDMSATVEARTAVSMDAGTTLHADVRVAANGRVSATALEAAPQVSVQMAGGSVCIFAGGDATVTVGTELKPQTVSVTAAGSLSGTAHATRDLHLSAFTVDDQAPGSILDMTGSTGEDGGLLSLFATGAIAAGAAGFNAADRLDVNAAQTVSGTYRAAAGGAAISAGGDVNVALTVVNGGSADVSSTGSIAGTIDAAGGSATVWAVDAVGAAVTAADHVTVTSVEADVAGAVTGSGSSVDVFGAAGVTGNVRAGADARVTTWGGLSGSVHAGTDAQQQPPGSAEVMAQGTQSGVVHAAGSVQLFAGHVGAAVTAASGSADVVSAGDIDAPITAGAAASVSAVGSLTAGSSVHAVTGATVWVPGALLGDVTASAGPVAIGAGGRIDATLEAGTTLDVLGLGTVAGTLRAGGDVNLTAIGDLDAHVIAGHLGPGSANVSADGAVAGAFEARAGDVLIDAFGPVSADVTASAGASVSTFAAISGAIAAGTHATLTALTGPISGTVLTASGDARLFTAGAVAGTLDTGRDAQVDSLGGMDVTITAARDVALSALDRGAARIDVTAGGAVTLSALGDVSAPSVSAGGDVSVFVTGDVIGGADAAIHAAGFANVQVLGSLASTDLRGGQGVNLLSIGSITGGVTIASDGGAVEVLLGARGSFERITAAGDVRVAALGGFSGPVAAGGSATVVTFDHLIDAVSAAVDVLVVTTGAVTEGAAIDAGRDAYVIGYDAVSPAFLRADRDVRVLSDDIIDTFIDAGSDVAIVFAEGDLRGTITAGGDIQRLVTHGALAADVIAAGDIDTITARSNVTGARIEAGGMIGAIDAGGDIGGGTTILGATAIASVHSDGAIDAIVIAGAGAGTATGWIGHVSARGDVAGTIAAPQYVNSIRSGAAIGDTIATGSAAAEMVEYDRSLFGHYDADRPFTWTVQGDDHRWSLARVHAELLAPVLRDLAGLLEQLALLHAGLSGALAASAAQVARSEALAPAAQVALAAAAAVEGAIAATRTRIGEAVILAGASQLDLRTALLAGTGRAATARTHARMDGGIALAQARILLERAQRDLQRRVADEVAATRLADQEVQASAAVGRAVLASRARTRDIEWRQAAAEARQRILEELDVIRDLMLDVVQTGLDVVSAVVSFIPVAGNAVAVGIELVNLGITKLRGHEISGLQVAMLAAVALPGGGAARLARIGSRFARTMGRVASASVRGVKGARRAGAPMKTFLGRARGAMQLVGRTGQAPRTGLGRVAGQADAINPGSLTDDLASTFSGGRYSEVILDADTVLYRAGTANRPFGQFFDTVAPDSIIQARIDKAILPRWPGGATSPIDSVIQIRVPKGTKVFVGEVSSQGGSFVGGTRQIVVPKPWAIEGIKILSIKSIR